MKVRTRTLSREEALEQYLIYRKRVRELLDMYQIAKDIKKHKYEPRDLLGRGPERFSEAVGDAITALFSSLCDIHPAALNVFDVWLALFPLKKNKIARTRAEVEPHLKLIRRYRNDIVCHANKDVGRYVRTRAAFAESHDRIAKAMQAVAHLAAELMGDEATALPNLRADLDPILRRSFPNLNACQIDGLKDYFLQKETSGWGGRGATPLSDCRSDRPK